MKIFGAQLKMQYGPTGSVQIHRLWYSNLESVALEKMEEAQKIAPPENTTVEITPLESDVLITDEGVYKTTSGKLVHIYKAGLFHSHGRFLKANRKPMPHEGCTFFANGDPITHKKWGAIVERVGDK